METGSIMLYICIVNELIDNLLNQLIMKTIDIQGKEWFDRVNGNSYFSAQVTIDFGLDTERVVYVPFQYGYGSSYYTKSIEQLQKDGILPNDGTLSWSYFDDEGIILRSSLRDNCLKCDVIAFGSN